MDILSPPNDNQHPDYGDSRNNEETGYKELIPIEDSELIHKSGINKDGLYGLVILPILGLLISTLIIIARKYQFHWILRCLDCITRNPRADDDVEDIETEISNLPATTDSSISAIDNDVPIQHQFFWDDLFEYDPSMESNSDVLYVDSAVQTSPAEVTFAEEEQFGFENDEHNVMSSLDEDEIIYVNIKEPNISEDIMRFNSTINSEQDMRSATRSGKVYK